MSLYSYFLQFLFNPSKQLTDQVERSRAKLLSVLIFIYFLAMLGILLLLVIISHPRYNLRIPDIGIRNVSLSLSINFIAYLVSRTRYFHLSCYLAIMTMVSFNFWTLVGTNDAALVGSAMGWLIVPTLLSSLILSNRETTVTIFGTCIGILALFPTLDRSTHGSLFAMTFLYLTASSLALIASMMRNQTEKILAEQQSQVFQTSKLAALGEMAGAISHEINNPLAAIKNICGQIQELASDDPIDKILVKEMAHTAETTSDRIAKIISGLRSFSRDSNRDPFKVIVINQMIEETMSFCRARFNGDDTKLIIESPDSTLSIEGDSVQLSQVLINLLNNSHDAIENLSEKWAKLSVTDTKEGVEIRVTDSGRGIPVNIQKKIFQPFFTTKEIGKGTGLGLSLSNNIIQKHHGTLKVDPLSPNTSFVIYLPKKQRSTRRVTSA